MLNFCEGLMLVGAGGMGELLTSLDGEDSTGAKNSNFCGAQSG